MKTICRADISYRALIDDNVEEKKFKKQVLFSYGEKKQELSNYTEYLPEDWYNILKAKATKHYSLKHWNWDGSEKYIKNLKIKNVKQVDPRYITKDEVVLEL